MWQISWFILVWMVLAGRNVARNLIDDENSIVINLNINIDPSQEGKNNSTGGKLLIELTNLPSHIK